MELHKEKWHSRLMIWVVGILFFELVSGLVIYLISFSITTQSLVVIHTAVGLVAVISYIIYQIRHWLTYRKNNLTQHKLIGYIAMVTAAGAAITGLLLTYEAVFLTTNVTKKAGINFHGCGMGVAAGDMDNDGYPDIFITAYGKNVFYHNNGNGTFTDETGKAGFGGREGFWAGASWADYDRDGYLDLYVCGYVKYSQLNKQPALRRENNEEPAGINPY